MEDRRAELARGDRSMTSVANILHPMNLDALETQLAILMKGYRDSLRFVEGLPGLGRVPVEYPEEKQTARANRGWIVRAVSRVSNPRHRWVARPLARLFVEAHIRMRLEVIIRLLRIEASASIEDPESNARAKKLKSLIAPLDELQKALFSWKQRGALFARIPILPVLIAVATPFVARYTGIDLSGAKSIAESTIERAQSGGLTRSLVLAAILLGELYMICAPAITSLGFRVKRAILEGGTTVWRLFDVPERITWGNFPTTNIYQVENRVFDVIAVPKPREFPLDLVMSFLPFYVLVLTAVFSAAAISHVFGGEGLTRGEALGIAALWGTLVSFAYYGRNNFLRRRAQGNM
jgi:hypothetical protein